MSELIEITPKEFLSFVDRHRVQISKNLVDRGILNALASIEYVSQCVFNRVVTTKCYAYADPADPLFMVCQVSSGIRKVDTQCYLIPIVPVSLAMMLTVCRYTGMLPVGGLPQHHKDLAELKSQGLTLVLDDWDLYLPIAALAENTPSVGPLMTVGEAMSSYDDTVWPQEQVTLYVDDVIVGHCRAVPLSNKLWHVTTDHYGYQSALWHLMARKLADKHPEAKLMCAGGMGYRKPDLGQIAIYRELLNKYKRPPEETDLVDGAVTPLYAFTLPYLQAVLEKPKEPVLLLTEGDGRLFRDAQGKAPLFRSFVAVEEWFAGYDVDLCSVRNSEFVMNDVPYEGVEIVVSEL